MKLGDIVLVVENLWPLAVGHILEVKAEKLQKLHFTVAARKP